MALSKERIDRWQGIATIFSLLFVPVFLTVGGWWFQDRVSTESIKKEYVQLAIQILRDAPPKDEKENSRSQPLRAWAVEVVDSYSPIPLSQAAREELLRKKLGVGLIAWDQISRGENCAQYLIITDDLAGFDECARRLRERLLQGPNPP